MKEKEVKNKMDDDLLNITIKIEFSNKDAHWKSNSKCIVRGYANMHPESCKHCEICKGDECPLLLKLTKSIERILKDL